MTQVRTRKINYEMAKIAWEEEQRNAAVRNQQLNREYEKVLEDRQQQEQIAALDEDTYQHVYAMYQKEVVGLDKLMLAQQKALQSQMNGIAAKWNSEWVKNKIQIGNAK